MSDDRRDLTSGPEWRSLLALALPMVFGIVAALSVSLVDTYFVGKLGTAPLAALSFSFPVTMAMTSLSIGLGAGAASVVSRAVGGKNEKEAKRLATDSLILATLAVLLISVTGFFTIRPLFSTLGATGETLDLIVRYMRIWYVSMPFLVVPMVAHAIIRSIGDAFWPSAIMIGAAAINIASTPMFIFGLGPIPAFDIEGAAIGTLVARIATLFLSLYIVIYRERLLTFEWPAFDEAFASWTRVLKVAVPAALGNMVNPVGIALVTAILATFGEQVVAAFGIATRIESFASIPMLALSSAIGPVAGQNWGADRSDRVVNTLQIAFGICAAWAVVLAVVFWFAANPIVALFAPEEAVRKEAATYLMIVPITLFGYGCVIVAAATYNALGKSRIGLAYYLVRTAALYVPLSWIVVMIGGSTTVYWAIALSNAVAGIAVAAYALWWLRRAEQKDCQPQTQRNEEAMAL